MSHGKKESQGWSRRVGAQRACTARGPWFGGGVVPGGGGAQPGNRGPDCGPRLAHPFVRLASLLPASCPERWRRDYRQFVSPNLSLVITFGGVSLSGTWVFGWGNWWWASTVLCSASHFHVAQAAGRRRRRNVNPTAVTPAHKPWVSRGENWFHVLQNSPLLPRFFIKGSLNSISQPPHPQMCVLGPTSHFGNLGLSYVFFVCFSCLFLCVCGCGCLSNTQSQGPHSKLEPFTFVSLFFPSSGTGGCGGQEAAFPEDGAAGAAAMEQLLCLAPLFSIIKIQFQNFCLEQFPKEPMKDAKRVGPFSSGRVSAEGSHWPSCPRLCPSGAVQWTVSKTEGCAHLDWGKRSGKVLRQVKKMGKAASFSVIHTVAGAQPGWSWGWSSEPSEKFSLFNLTIPHLISSPASHPWFKKKKMSVYLKVPFC